MIKAALTIASIRPPTKGNSTGKTKKADCFNKQSAFLRFSVLRLTAIGRAESDGALVSPEALFQCLLQNQ